MKLKIFERLVIFAFFLIGLYSCCGIRSVTWILPDDKDMHRFETSKIYNTDSVFVFEKAAYKNSLPDSIYLKNSTISTNDFMKSTKTTALILIKNDSIIFEKYYNGYMQNSIAPVFSITKTVIGTLIGIAHKEGFIGSVKDPIVKYIPELKDKRLHSITIEELLNMRSGIKFSMDYWNPWGKFSHLHYGRNFSRYVIRKSRAKNTTEKDYKYSQIDAQLLGLILTRSTGKSVSQYMEEKIWKPLGMQYPAHWNLDSKKNMMENCGSGLNMNPLDLAKIGRLYLKDGKWGDKEILEKSWVNKSTRSDSATIDYYTTYQWKHTLKVDSSASEEALIYKDKHSHQTTKTNYIRENDFFTAGMNKQRIMYVLPEKNLIIVKFSKGYLDRNSKEVIYKLAKQIQ